MTSFLRTRKDRHPKHDKPRLPHEHDQRVDHQQPARSAHQAEQHVIGHAYHDIREGQVDTDLRGTGGLDEINKEPGRRAAGAPPKAPDRG